MKPAIPIQHILSLPRKAAEALAGPMRQTTPPWFVSCDPPGSKLGSGGGTAHLLVAAWRETGETGTAQSSSFEEWLLQSQKLLIHGGGQSRRLPAYAALGKPLIPLPARPHSVGQSIGQTLLDMQIPGYVRVLRHASPETALLLASGDVYLRFDSNLPSLPSADVVAVGMRVDAETAQHFGVFFLPRSGTDRPSFFLQKPAVSRIQELSEQYDFLVDSGLWLLSKTAVLTLMERCGWQTEPQQFCQGGVSPYELYAEFGLSLGETPVARDAAINALSCAVVTLPGTAFYHLGTSRQLIASVTSLLDSSEAQTGLAIRSRSIHHLVQNAICSASLKRASSHSLWIENAHIPASWQVSRDHVLTNIPENTWELVLEPGCCLDMAPVGETAFCVRAYGMDDRFSGVLSDPATHWMGQPAQAWFQQRDIAFEAAGIASDDDIYQAPLFPVLELAQIDTPFLHWLLAAPCTEENAGFRERWLHAPRLSAAQITQQINLARLQEQRLTHQRHALRQLKSRGKTSFFYHLDLERTADLLAEDPAVLENALPESRLETASGLEPATGGDSPSMLTVHRHSWRAALWRKRGEARFRDAEQEAFRALRQIVLAEVQESRPCPVRQILEDQIVWGRSPVRLDLAGGWTDTPPYCLLHGGCVTNLAVNLNGQSPIQVFAKLCEQPEIVLRSIDRGVEQRIRTYEELNTFAEPGNAFALAKAALALAGFLPPYHAQANYTALRQQLQAFGGGIELSLLAAVPQGSGLGTSSILAATLLGTLSEMCGLGWTPAALINKTLALEQMVTTGGGWQDQAGGLFRGIKMVETFPGPAQTPIVQWLPEYLFTDPAAHQTMLLYYTGVTRMAKNILQEIVRGMFFNSARVQHILEDIAANARFVQQAIQFADRGKLCEGVHRSWILNQALDAGTNPESIQDILRRIDDYVESGKLLGAGGGGYLLLMAKDARAALHIRHVLETDPPNPRARFVEFTLSSSGMEITRS